MAIIFSKQPWNKKVDTYNYFDLGTKDPRKAQLDQYFIGKQRPDPAVLKTEKVFKRKG